MADENVNVYTALKWDQTAEKLYETGVKNVALYVKNDDGSYRAGVAWNGITSISESPSGAEETALYADDVKYLALRSAEDLGGTIEAYMFPDEWKECDGRASLMDGFPGVDVSQQARRAFGLVYKTTIGNDVQNNDYGYKLHILYNGSVSPSERQYQTINDSPEAITFNWEFSTTPETMPGKLKPASLITLDSTKMKTDAQKAALKKIEEMLYGKDGTPAVEGASATAGTDPKLPTPDELLKILKDAMTTQNPSA